jgi:hypothetical protein
LLKVLVLAVREQSWEIPSSSKVHCRDDNYHQKAKEQAQAQEDCFELLELEVAPGLEQLA